MADEKLEKMLKSQVKQAKMKFEDRAVQDLKNALSHFKDLTPEVRKHRFPDGTERLSLCLHGTIPINYRGATYHIPVALYCLDNHPYAGPYSYVTPTNDMAIRVSQVVDQTGRIYLPYLTEWQYSSYDTYGLLQVMTISFQEKSPVYSSRQNGGTRPPPQPPQPTPPQHSPYPQNTPYPTQPVGMPQPYNAPAPNQPPYPNSGYTAPYQPFVNMPSPASVPANLSANSQQHNNSNQSLNHLGSAIGTAYSYNTIQPSHIRDSLASAVEDKIRQRIKEVMGTPYAELQSIDVNLQELRTGNHKLREMIENMEKENSRLQSLKVVYEDKQAELTRALDAYKSAQSEDPDAAVDSAIDATTPLHRQIVNCYVQDCAIDDTVYFLGQALKKGTINLQVYLKCVRQLSRKQFIQRATMQKARQMARLPI